MKKTKHLLIVLVLVLVTALALSVLAACKDKDKPNTETTKTEELQSIELDTSKVNTSFYVGDAFSSTGLVVYANILVTDDNSSETVKRDVTSSANVVSTAFKSNEAGTYKITVSYLLNNIYKEAEYSVTVSERRYGVDVILQEGVFEGIDLSDDKASGEITLTSELKSVTIDPTKIEVREPDEFGIIDYDSAPLAASDYTIKVFKNADTEIEEFTNLTSGSYEIWVYLDSEDADYVRKSFAQVFVIDNLVSLTFDSEADGTLLKQNSGEDKISSTWKFIATYVSGETENLTITDLADESGKRFADKLSDTTTVVDTTKSGSQTITVYYNAVLASGAIDTKSVDVNYSITKVGGTVTETINIGELVKNETLSVATYTENKALGNGVTVLATSDASVAIDANSKSITVGDSKIDLTHRLKLGGAGSATARSIKFEVEGASTIVVYLMSSSSTADREVGLYTVENEEFTLQGTTKTVGGSSLEKFEFTVDEAGTYYLAAVSGGTNVYYITVTTTVSAQTSAVFNVSELVKNETLSVATYTENKALGNGVTVLAASDASVAIDANSKSITVGDAKIDLTHRLKLGGAGSATARSIKFEVEGASTIVVYMMSSSSGDSREVGLYTVKNDEFTLQEGTAKTVGGTSLEKFEFTVDEAGTYYLAAKSGGTNVYYITVTTTISAQTSAVFNVSELVKNETLSATTYTENKALGNGVTVLAASDASVAIDANSKSITVGDAKIDLTHRLKLGGAGSATARSIKFEVEGASTIVVYMMSSSASDSREVGLYTVENEEFTLQGTTKTVGGSSLEKFEFTVDEAGTYYLAAVSGGTNVYYITVESK